MSKLNGFLTLVVTLLAVTTAGRADAGDAKPDAPGLTGLREAGPEQTAWMLKHFPLAKSIRPNKRALDRLNAERKQHGQHELNEQNVPLARQGEEILSEAAGTGSAGTESLSGATPASVDNSLLPSFPPIGRQVVGSCVAWASTYYVMTHETSLARGLDAKNVPSNRFSPKWTYNMINGGVDGGSYGSDAWALLIKHGAARNSDFPEDGNIRAWDLDAAAWRAAVGVRVSSTSTIYNANTDTLIAMLKQQLANGHVVFFGTFVYSWEQRTVGNDPATTADDAFVNQAICRYQVNNNSGGHAMTIVGYEDSIWCDVNLNGVVDAGEKGAFKIANSWGTGDWNGGYRWVAYDALRATTAVAGGPTNRSAIFTTNGWPNTITVAPAYTPTLLAEFTVNHAKRSQLRVKLGLDANTKTVPSYQWTPAAINLQGGAYAFDGSTTAVDGTFTFDFSDLNPSLSQGKRYFLSIYDSASGDAATVKSFRLLNGAGSVLASSANTPKTADGGQESWCWIDYGTGNYIPVIETAPWASPNPVNFPNPTTVRVVANDMDSGPSAMTYTWSKLSGPGTVSFSPNGTTSSNTSTATYSAVGTYVLRVTISDGADSIYGDTTVQVTDANAVNAPSSLYTSVSGTTVTLNWTDNSSNETGFQIDRGVTVRKTTTWTTNIATVGANTTTFSQTVANGTYVYRVRAFNSATGVVSANSNQATAKVGTNKGGR